ncbi:MAG: MarR family transcriptional regulator [Xanthobacteraceae bacterium]|jgi:DNA-binding MarR family transcriptional regulator|nr:MarR family transcriptional regulator [Xanthobacteraceae bacterium]
MELEQATALDAETKIAEAPGDHKAELRLWLRLLATNTLIENEIRRRLRERFDVTLPRFDLMAQLERKPHGMTLGELSQRMMVTNGNVTGLVDRLLAEEVISRKQHKSDRRSHIVSLTEKGRRQFAKMAKEHENWIAGMFGELSQSEFATLTKLLGKLKTSVRNGIAQN